MRTNDEGRRRALRQHRNTIGAGLGTLGLSAAKAQDMSRAAGFTASADSTSITR